MLKITEARLRQIINEELSLHQNEQGKQGKKGVNTGEEIKGNSVSDKATSKIIDNPAIKALLDQVNSVDGLASLLQNILTAATEKGMDRSKALAALSKVAGMVKKAK